MWFDFGFVTCLWFWWLGFEVVGSGGCGCGLWWLVLRAMGSGFRFCSAGFQFCSGLGFLKVGGSLGFLIMVVVGGGCE